MRLLPVLCALDRPKKSSKRLREATAQQIAFYGSTPAYKPVLDSIGVGELQGDLNSMSKQGRWVEMGELITPEIMSEFAIIGEPDKVAGQDTIRTAILLIAHQQLMQYSEVRKNQDYF